jgi:hypothetical protein
MLAATICGVKFSAEVAAFIAMTYVNSLQAA